MKSFIKKLTGIAIINFLFLLLVVLVVLPQKQPAMLKVNPVTIVSETPQATQSAQVATSSSTPAPAKNLFTELSKHNVKSDCWMGYKGNVYDITAVFGTHPGGDSSMLPYCGTDATVGFDTKGRSSGMPHSASATSLLQQYLVQ